MEAIGVTPLNGSEIVLKDLGARFSGGRQLTYAEEGMAMTAAASVTAESFGPSPSTMKLTRPELPENIKGILVQYST